MAGFVRLQFRIDFPYFSHSFQPSFPMYARPHWLRWSLLAAVAVVVASAATAVEAKSAKGSPLGNSGLYASRGHMFRRWDTKVLLMLEPT